jgi:Protein of unknown function (DUF4232)
MRAAPLVVLPLVLLTAACSGSSSPSAASPTAPVTVAATATATGAVTATPSVSRATSPAGSVATCRTSRLSLRMGNGGAAAGTAYQPIVFTNHGSGTCALRGYPGVAFVAPATGRQVGSAASHNPQQPVTTILITPDSSVSALLGIANYQNFPPGECLSHPVSGLRIYPPGNTAAAYVPFKAASAACSTQVGQLNVAAVVAGSTGQ